MAPILNNDAQDWLQGAIKQSGATIPSRVEHDDVLADLANEPAAANMLAADDDRHYRRLVTLRTISSLRRIGGNRQLATIDAWTVVVRTAREFKSGERVIFLEPDAFIPTGILDDQLCKDADMVPATFKGRRGYRAAHDKVEILPSRFLSEDNFFFSQGAILHLSDCPQILYKERSTRQKAKWDEQLPEYINFLQTYDIGRHLHVSKYTLEEPSGTRRNPKVPSFILKTEMERVQNCPNLFIKDKYKTMTFQETKKMDGAAMTVYFLRGDSRYWSTHGTIPLWADPELIRNCHFEMGRAGVCTRNLEILRSPDANKYLRSDPYFATAIRLGLPKILAQLAPCIDSIAIQGELVGSKINGNPHCYAKNSHHDFYIYSIFDIESGKRWDPRRTEDWVKTKPHLKHVPVLGYHTVRSIAKSHEELLTRAYLTHGEGLVFKCLVDGRWFKVLSERWFVERGDEKLYKGIDPTSWCINGWVSPGGMTFCKWHELCVSADKWAKDEGPNGMFQYVLRYRAEKLAENEKARAREQAMRETAEHRRYQLALNDAKKETANQEKTSDITEEKSETAPKSKPDVAPKIEAEIVSKPEAEVVPKAEAEVLVFPKLDHEISASIKAETTAEVAAQVAPETDAESTPQVTPDSTPDQTRAGTPDLTSEEENQEETVTSNTSDEAENTPPSSSSPQNDETPEVDFRHEGDLTAEEFAAFEKHMEESWTKFSQETIAKAKKIPANKGSSPQYIMLKPLEKNTEDIEAVAKQMEDSWRRATEENLKSKPTDASKVPFMQLHDLRKNFQPPIRIDIKVPQSMQNEVYLDIPASLAARRHIHVDISHY